MEITNHNSGPKQIEIYNLLVSIKLWFNYLLRKWWLICIVGLLSGGVGFFIAWLDKPTYQSHLTFALEDGEGGLGGALSLAAEFGLNFGSSSNMFQGDNIVSLLTSRRIIERVLLSVDTLNGKPSSMADYWIRISKDNTKKPSKSESRLSMISFPAGQPRNSFSYLQDSVLMVIYTKMLKDGNLKVSKPDKKLNLYEVSFVSPDERFTKIFTDKLVKEATEFYIEIKSKRSKQTLEILEQRVEQTRLNLNRSISSRATVQDADLNPVFQQAQAQLQKKQVDISAYGGAYGELYKNLELARYQYLKDVPLLQIIDGAEYPMKRVKKGKLQTGLAYAIIFSLLITCFLIIKKLYTNSLNENKVVTK